MPFFDCWFIDLLAPDTDNKLTRALLKIQDHDRQGRYAHLSIEDIVVIPTSLVQARWVIPLGRPMNVETPLQSDGIWQKNSGGTSLVSFEAGSLR